MKLLWVLAASTLITIGACSSGSDKSTSDKSTGDKSTGDKSTGDKSTSDETPDCEAIRELKRNKANWSVGSIKCSDKDTGTMKLIPSLQTDPSKRHLEEEYVDRRKKRTQ